MPRIGTHLLMDFFEIDADRLRDADLAGAALLLAAERGRMTPVAAPVIHPFPGGGLTGYLLLRESHIAVHTYPEHGYAAFDLFACGRADPPAALDALRATFRPGRERVRELPRGEDAADA